MSEPFVVITTHRVRPGQLEEFKALSRQYMEFVAANEPRTGARFASLDTAETEASLVQIHPDSASADQHMQVAGELIGQGLALTETVGIEVYGEPGPVARRGMEANAAEGVPLSIKSRRLGTFVNRPAINGTPA